ncbi:MAG: hypothetical protein AB7O74_06920 [Candidatus Nanopelagicales bacterium]
MVTSPARLADARQDRLLRLRDKKQLPRVLHALHEEWADGLQPERVLFRLGVAKLAKPAKGPYSDRKLPPREQRPPITRLIAPRSAALDLLTTAVFLAQCEAHPGRAPRVLRPLTPDVAVDEEAPRAWSDLLALDARHAPGGKTHYTPQDNRIRQLRSAVKRLADPDVQLVSLPNAVARVGRFDELRLLLESGPQGASEIPYKVPVAREACFSLPSTFFLNGWHSVLTNSEVALLFCLLAHRAQRAPWGDEVVAIDGETRVHTFGLGPDAYATHRELAAFGLIEVVVDEGRREDGTYAGFSEAEQPKLHRLRVVEAGFEKRADAVVPATLKGLGR